MTKAIEGLSIRRSITTPTDAVGIQKENNMNTTGSRNLKYHMCVCVFVCQNVIQQTPETQHDPTNI